MAKAAAMDVSDDERTKRQEPSPPRDTDYEDEPEFEIEQIIKHKNGMFPNGKTGFLVKWKGYPDDENSYVNEDDAAGAQELIEDYFRKLPAAKKGGRKSVGTTKAVSAEAEEISTSRKRKAGRVSQDEEPEVVIKPRSKPSPAKKAPVSQDRAAKRAKVVDEDSDNAPLTEQYGTMEAYMRTATWEKFDIHVETVEKQGDSLIVYFEFNPPKGGRERASCDSAICAKKFPQSMIKFYEDNLKWRKADD